MAGRKPTDFVLRPSALGTEEFYHQTLSENYRLTIDSIAQYVDNYIGGDTPVANGTRLSSGGKVIWQSGLTFLVTSAVYYINGVRFESDEQTHTLDAADPTNPRFDRFYLDVDGLFGAVTGTPAADPLAPTVDPTTQISLTIAEVAAAATTPSNITGDLIYDENVGVAGGEWDTSATVPLNVDFASTDDPSTNTVRIKTTGSSETQNILKFTYSGLVTISDYQFLVMDVKQEARIGTAAYIKLAWYDTSGGQYISSRVVYPGQFGFFPGTSGWQTVAVDIAAFLPVSESIEADQLEIEVPLVSSAYQWGFDNIRLQGGLEPQQQPYDFYTHKNTIWVDGNGSDETGKRGRFDEPFRTVKEAERVALSGDTIIVMPGVYTDRYLGKNGVTYKLEAGATLQATSDILFWDNGSAISFDIIGNGIIKNGTSGVIMTLSAASTVNIKCRLLDLNNTGNVNQIQISGGADSVLNIVVDEINAVGRRGISVSGNNTNSPRLTLKANYIYSTTEMFQCLNGGEMYLEWNYAEHNPSLGSRPFSYNPGGIVYAKGNIKSTALSTTALFAVESNNVGTGSTVGNTYYTGVVEYNSTGSPFDVQETGKLHLINVKCTWNDVSATSPIIEMDQGGLAGDPNTTVILDNVTLINLNQDAGSQGINIGNNSPAGYANIEFNTTRILLHSTAVGLGAKAIDANGASINYKAYTDTLSNGAFDGTNLISSTIGVVDANAKSD